MFMKMKRSCAGSDLRNIMKRMLERERWVGIKAFNKLLRRGAFVNVN